MKTIKFSPAENTFYLLPVDDYPADVREIDYKYFVETELDKRPGYKRIVQNGLPRLIVITLSDAEQEQAAYQQWKQERIKAVDAIKVEVDGLIFDGDETSQTRMVRAATIAESPTEQINWILADNSVATVTADQLRRAAREAGRVQETLWIRQEA